MNNIRDGRRVKYGDVRYEEVDRYKVSPEFAAAVQNRGKHFELSENERNRLKEKLSDNDKPAPLWSSIVAVVIVLALALLPTALMAMNGSVGGAVVWLVIMTAVAALALFTNLNHKKLVKGKLNALENGKYAAYEFEVTQKMWCGYRVNKRQTESYYIDCGGMVFLVHEDEYDEVGERVATVLFFLDGETVLEYFAPDGGKRR
ncbi:MAG: hypothetical protein LBI38_06840 [Oscillospiraceae bacterium]|nr:hypothetical protein [Oscillospiraceae bacterium]